MKPSRSYVFFAALAATTIGVAVLNGRAYLQRIELQAARDMARIGTGELAGLRAENRRLRDQQIPPTELASLRADREALARLRAELDVLANSKVSAPR